MLDRLDGSKELYGPAPQSEMTADNAASRLFVRLHREPHIDAAEAEQRLAKQGAFDPDIWIAEVEDREGRSFLDVADRP